MRRLFLMEICMCGLTASVKPSGYHHEDE